jgi:hypothetical protein
MSGLRIDFLAPPAFDKTSAAKWAYWLGTCRHPTIPTDCCEIQRNHRSIQLRNAPPVSRAIYVGIDDAETPLYVGSVCRDGIDALNQRFRNHHAIPISTVAAWVFPIADCCTRPTVRRLEARMIYAIKPPFNFQHNPRRSSVRQTDSDPDQILGKSS